MGELRRGRFVCHEGELEVIDDAVDQGIVGQESDDAHRPSASRAEHRVNLIHLADHLSPVLGGDGPEILLPLPERKRPETCSAPSTPVKIDHPITVCIAVPKKVMN